MRKNYLLILLFSVFIYNSYGQGHSTCATAAPFCASSSGNSLTFSNTTNAPPAEAGINYSCLLTRPNPAWFYLQIKQAGDLNFVISQTSNGGSGLDVDFIAWGPFLSPVCGPANLNPSTQIDCSYEMDATESFSINDALVGEYYMVLITNFSNDPGKIKLTQLNSSTGSTNCDIVCPLSITGGGVPVCKNPVLTALYVNSVNPTFQWYYNNNQQIPNATNISYTPTQPGTYTIVANSPGCGVNQTVSVEVPENPVISIGQPRNPLLACTFANFDLTVNTAMILAGLSASNYVVNYHRTLFDAQNNVLPILPANSYPGTNGETIYVSIHDLVNPTCITTTQFKLKTLPCGPIPVKPADLSLCDDISNDGIETFDLSQQYETIIGANNPTKFTTTFHTSLADADNDINPITSINTYQNIGNPQVIYVRLEENTNPLNYGTTSFKLIVNPIATVSIVGSTICAPIKAETNIPGTYSYQWTVPDGVDSPGNVAIFTTTLPGTYSVVVTNTDTNCVSEMASGVVSDSTFPTVSVTSPVVCDESLATVTAIPGTPGTYTYVWTVPSGVADPGNVASFTTLKEGTYRVKITNAISNCVSANGIGIVSHIPLPTVTVNSQRICQGGTATVVATPGVESDNYIYIWTVPTGAVSPGSTPSFNTTVGGTYSVVIKDIRTNCYSHSASGEVVVSLLPGVVPNVITPTICSGQTTNVELPITMPGTQFTWTAFATGVSGSTDGTGELIAQTLLATGDVTGTVVYTITPRVNECEGRTSIVTIYVTPIPVATATPTSQIICSETRTFIELTSPVSGTIFNWTVVQNRVRGAVSGTGNTIEQLLTSTSTIPGEVIYTIYPIFGNCQGAPITVVITVSPKPEIFGFSATTICDATSTNITLSPNLPDTTLEWTVVQTNVTGASNGNGLFIDQILNLTGNGDGTAVYTVTPTSNGCVGKPIDIVVTVKSLPIPEISGGLICVNEPTDVATQTYTLDTGMSSSIYEFKWYLNDVYIDNANNSYYEATQSGIYGVTATDIATGCVSNIFYATVTDAFIGQSVTAVIEEAFSENPTVIVHVNGGNVQFLYQLDNGIPQSSNVFSPVSLGTHTVTVTDVNDCTSLTTEVFVIGYPHYFTPNGDGVHDTWNVIGFANQPNAKIFIYDRFGKLLKQISTTGEGWDGTYNGILLPSTDYWFTIDYLENGVNKVFKSHFALKIN